MKVEKFDETTYIRALIYGDSGSGKTTLLGSATQCPETSPLLVLNAGGQPVSLRNCVPRPLVLTVAKMTDFNSVYEWLAADQPTEWLDEDGKLNRAGLGSVLNDYFESIECGDRRFGMLGIDSITQVQRIALEQLAGSAPLPGSVPPQTQIQHWGRALAMMTNLANKYFKLPIHTMMTALTRRDTIESLGLTLFCPFLWGQSSLEVPSHAEMVGRLRCTHTISPTEQAVLNKRFGGDVPHNIIYMRGGRDYIAKWQGVNNPPAVVAGPTVAKFVEIMAESSIAIPAITQ